MDGWVCSLFPLSLSLSLSPLPPFCMMGGGGDGLFPLASGTGMDGTVPLRPARLHSCCEKASLFPTKPRGGQAGFYCLPRRGSDALQNIIQSRERARQTVNRRPLAAPF